MRGALPGKFVVGLVLSSCASAARREGIMVRVGGLVWGVRFFVILDDIRNVLSPRPHLTLATNNVK